eukprot:6195113-Pleurochrysis_carterae.AAC.1
MDCDWFVVAARRNGHLKIVWPGSCVVIGTFALLSASRMTLQVQSHTEVLSGVAAGRSSRMRR